MGTLLAVVGVAGLFFVLMTSGQTANECRVCVTFHGQSNCATATGSTEQHARDGAQTTACGILASGMDQTITCGRIPPDSVQCRTR
ncbi:MAG: hypothetical protein A3J75_04445 [Acidobacteria bacterium RBG_16_68_9]|nr:MAG: hypothetical protein A3J75_04445 [Acidobacteria bacterium RBG_16_68_9]